MELEAEVAKLKEMNQELQKKQVYYISKDDFIWYCMDKATILTSIFYASYHLQREIMETQKNQVHVSLI